MDDFNRQLSRVLRYGTDTVNTLLSELQKPEYGPHRWGDETPTNGLRGVLADAMDEAERPSEASLLRTPNQHVVLQDGRVRAGRFTSKHLRRNDADVQHLLNDATDGDYVPDYDYSWSDEHHYPLVDFVGGHWEGGEGMHIGDVPSELAHHLTNIAEGYRVNGPDMRDAIRGLRNSSIEEVDDQHPTERKSKS